MRKIIILYSSIILLTACKKQTYYCTATPDIGSVSNYQTYQYMSGEKRMTKRQAKKFIERGKEYGLLVSCSIQ